MLISVSVNQLKIKNSFSLLTNQGKNNPYREKNQMMILVKLALKLLVKTQK